ncbi:MAG: septum formation initiator family protein [Clostridia bacterium]|nr:septum formation initiator family protein [Clostridia bacterium]
MSDRAPGSFLERLFSLRLRPLALLCALFVIISLGVMMINSVRDETSLLQERVKELGHASEALSRQLKQLEVEVKQVGTDDYIIRKAREQYGMVMPNELLFVVGNPEALYGSGDAVQLYVAEGTE